MLAFLLGCVPFALGGLTATFVWRKALEAEQRGEPSGLRSLSGFALGANVYLTFALLLWERVQFPMLFVLPLAIVTAPLALVVLLVAVVRQRDVGISAWALASAVAPPFVFIANPPMA